MKDPTRPSLDTCLANVRLEVPVPNDLWPLIARKITRPESRFRAFALAASLMVVYVAAGVGWLYWQGQPAHHNDSMAKAHRPLSFDEPRDPSYRAARSTLESSFRERLALLDPATRAKIATSLTDIQQAHEQIRQALRAQPDSPVLLRLLESTLHDEFDLYDSVIQGTQPAILRS